jgi:hypothetical protein
MMAWVGWLQQMPSACRHDLSAMGGAMIAWLFKTHGLIMVGCSSAVMIRQELADLSPDIMCLQASTGVLLLCVPTAGIA